MLDKIKKIFGNRRFAILVLGTMVVASLIYGVLSERNKERKQAQEPPKPPVASSSEGITPGKSTESDLEKLGQAREIKENPDQTKSYLFGLKSDPEPTRIDVKEGTVIFVQKRPGGAGPLFLKDLISQFGQPNLELYSQLPGLKAYVFLDSGIAAIAMPDTGTITQLRYFVPSTQEEFRETWGKDFLSSQPTLPPFYY